jgi:hypothetical protein
MGITEMCPPRKFPLLCMKKSWCVKERKIRIVKKFPYGFDVPLLGSY